MWPQLQPGGRGAPCHSPSSPLLRREGPGVFLQASFPDPNPLWPRVVARGGVCIPWASGDAQPVLPPSSLRSSFLGLGPGPLHSLCRSETPGSQCAPPPPIGLLVVSGVWERQDKWSLFAGGKDCLQGIRESKKACCGSRHMSLGRAKAGQVLGGSGWGTRGMEEVAPWTSLLRPLGIPGSFPKEFLVCVFLPSATNCHSPDQTFLLSCPGWGLMAP